MTVWRVLTAPDQPPVRRDAGRVIRRGAMPPKEDEMDEIEAKVLVTKAIAEGLPTHPEWVRECMRNAAESMDEIALERGRVTSEPPRFVDARDTRLGYVELTFTAPTRVK